MELAIAIIVIVAVMAGVFYLSTAPSNPYELTYGGLKFRFRGNLEEAKNITVYPDTTALRNVLFGDFTRKYVLVWIDNTTIVGNQSINDFYAAAGFDLGTKFPVLVQNHYGESKPLSPYNVSSIEEAKNLSDRLVPVIMFVSPPYTDRTAITVDGYLIKLEAKDFTEIDRVYTDLDLVVAKLILTLM